MLDRNVGLWDRVIRVIVGLALIAGFWVFPESAWKWAFWVGVIPAASGLVGYCPGYHLLGWSTNRDGDGTAAA